MRYAVSHSVRTATEVGLLGRCECDGFMNGVARTDSFVGPICICCVLFVSTVAPPHDECVRYASDFFRVARIAMFLGDIYCGY